WSPWPARWRRRGTHCPRGTVARRRRGRPRRGEEGPTAPGAAAGTVVPTAAVPVVISVEGLVAAGATARVAVQLRGGDGGGQRGAGGDLGGGPLAAGATAARGRRGRHRGDDAAEGPVVGQRPSRC